MSFYTVLIDNLYVIVEAISGIGTVILAGAMGIALKALRKQRVAGQAGERTDFLYLGFGKKGDVTDAHITRHST